MKGLLKNNFYGVIENLKIALAFVMLVGVLLLITGEATLLSAFSLIAPPIIALLMVSCVRKESASKWEKYKLTLPVRRKAIIESQYISHTIWSISGVVIVAVFMTLTVFIHGDQYFYYGFRDAMPFGKGCAGEPDIDRVTDDSKVTDHHAIIPTVEIARTDLSELPSGERDVLTLLAVRLLCATTQANRFEAVTAMLDCQGYTFTAKGKTILQSGWKEVERIHRMSIRQSETEHRENEDAALPVLKEGQTFEAVSASLREGKTSPPKHYTEDTLLSAMETAGAEDMPEDAERKGLGTPATRAATLEKLVSAGFVQRKKKQLIPTEKGKNLIAVLPDNIKSPILTAEWESMLKQVEHGELSATSFMDQIADMSRTLVKEHTTPEERFADLFPSSKGTAHEAVGVCPRCGAPVFEGKKGFFCGNRECSFALWKDNRFFSSKKKSITKSVAAALLKEGRISMSGLYSEKTGRTYDAEVILDDTGGKYVNFKLEFPVKKGRRK